jgi:peptidyl-prolyl cis-trans isomerase A (cyclophilin A)
MKQLLLSIGLASILAMRVSVAADPAPASVPPTSAAPPAGSTSPANAGSPVPAAALSSSPAAAATQSSPAAAGAVQVQVTTALGNFVIELNAERAPLTVENFLKYVDQGHYTGTVFHRVIANFLIQGGGYDANYKLKAAPNTVDNESGNGLSNVRGTVGMARAKDPHGADSQFYVNLFDNSTLDPNQTRWGYAVFGRVVQGMDVVDRIGNQATGAHAPFKDDVPLKAIVIERIERVATP